MTPEQLTIAVDETRSVSALWLAPPSAHAAYVFAHSAGAGMAHVSMSTIAGGLAERGIATLRYQFPYMEGGSKRPDTPKLCHATVRAAVTETVRRAPALPLFAGGRSFGGRMTSQAQALEALPNMRGLIFLGFPLHPAGKPSDERAAHLADVRIPMLFLTGTRDDLAHLDLLRPVIAKLGARATLHVLDHADHSFHVQARSGRRNDDVRTEALDAFALWISGVLGR
jgi:predicted alpha/beta-hydrolase family hydrolase